MKIDTRGFIVGLISGLASMLVLVLCVSPALAIETRPDFHKDAKQLHSRIIPHIQPSVAKWIDQQAGKICLGRMKDKELNYSMQTRFRGQEINPVAADSIRFMILMRAVKCSDDEINALRLKRDNIEADKKAVRAKMRNETPKSMADNLKRQLDGMNEMSEMTSLRLQMTMDRRSKFIETLSNIMKKIGTTQETLTQNLK